MNGNTDRLANIGSGSSNSVRVAVRIRPQNLHERAQNSNVCVTVTPGEPQVTIGRDKAFTYDHVFDQQTPQQNIYDTCVRHLVDGTFEGYNATVLAYGQTGSGKTYTMGTSFDTSQPETNQQTVGIIPRAARHFFESIEGRQDEARKAGKVAPSFEVTVQFIELYNEEIIDLLAEDRHRSSAAIRIHEDPVRHEIYLRGIASQQVNSPEDILTALKAGALNRTTAATNMNQQSSRSHAIFTVNIKQTRVVPVEVNVSDEEGEALKNGAVTGENSPSTETELEVLHAKFHFVDLAGSERLKRTGATGDRAKEGISINSGLLALGNVISALGCAIGRVGHVPYRDSKLTRLLQDSLGGNSRTLMIACASPSDVDFVETLNSLNYANRAKNIKNKVVANQNKSSKLITELRLRIQELEEELNEYKNGKRMVGEDGVEQVNDQYLENVQLQAENERLRNRVKALGGTVEIQSNRIVELQRDVEMAKIGGNLEDGGERQIADMVHNYLKELETLRTKLIEMQATNEQLQKQNNRFRAHLEQAGVTAANSLNNSPYAPQSHQQMLFSTTALLASARQEIALQKKALRNQLNVSSTSTPDEGQPDSEQDEVFIDEEEDEEEQPDEDEEVEDEKEKLSIERDRICGDLAQLQQDIDIKERLVAELESSQRRLEQLRQDYERKLGELSQRISSTEAERDRILEQMAVKKQTKQQKDEIAKVRDDYERKLASMRTEHRRLECAEKENKRMQVQQNRQQNEVNRFRQDLEAMKRQKVDLMKRLKEENKRIRELEIANAKRVANYEKLNRQQQNRITKLERETAQKAESLKRKMEEVQLLKKQKKDLQNRRQTIYELKGQQQKAIPIATNEAPPMTGDTGNQNPMDATFVVPNSTFIVENPAIPNPTDLPHANVAAPANQYDQQGAEDEDDDIGQPIRLSPQLHRNTRRISRLSQQHHQLRTPVTLKAPMRRSIAPGFPRATPMHTKRQWTIMERAIKRLVNKRTTMAKMEQGMNRQVTERTKLQDELDRLESNYGMASSSADRATILEQLTSVKEKLAYVQEEILKTQTSIVELDEQDAEPVFTDQQGTSLAAMLQSSPNNGGDCMDSLVFRFSQQMGVSPEAEYIVKHLLELVVDKGVEAGRMQAELKSLQSTNKELGALLGIGTDREVNEVVAAAQVNSARTASSSPLDEEVPEEPASNSTLLRPVLNGHPFALGGSSSSPQLPPPIHLPPVSSSQQSQRSVKHRRRTSTTEELLFPATTQTATTTLSVSPSEDKENKEDNGQQHHRKPLDPIQEVSYQNTNNSAGNDSPVHEICTQLQQLDMPISISTTSDPSSSSSGGHVANTNVPTTSSNPLLGHSTTINTTGGVADGSARTQTQRKQYQTSPAILDVDKNEAQKSNFLRRAYTIVGHQKGVWSLHANESMLISGSKDRTALVWDLKSGQCMHKLSYHPNNVMFVHLLPHELALTCSLNVVKVWDLRVGQCVRHLSSMGLVENGQNVPLERTEEVPNTETLITAAAVDPSQRCLFTTCRGGVRAWDLDKLQNIGIIGNQSNPLGDDLQLIAVSDLPPPSSQGTRSSTRRHKLQTTLAIGAGENMAVYSDLHDPLMGPQWERKPADRKFAISDINCIPLHTGHSDKITAMLIHRNTLFSATKDQSLMRFSLSDYKRDHVEPNAQSKPIKTMCMVTLGNGKVALATGCRAGTVKLWDIDSSNKMYSLDKKLKCHERGIQSMCANSQLLFTASNDETVAVYQILSGSEETN